MSDADVSPVRRVRPVIAALLTFLGWGVGFFYAGQTRTAVKWALASVLASVVLAFALIGFAIATRSPSIFVGGSLTAANVASLLMSACVAAVAWVVTSRNKTAPKAGAARLLGYLAIWLLPMLATVAVALCVRFTAYQPFRLPSGAMQPTLSVGDYFVVSKWSYGYGRFSFAPLPGPSDRVMARMPQRGDIAVFRATSQPRIDFVKRIVGMPGERIQMRGGVVYINEKPVPRVQAGMTPWTERDGSISQIPTYRETLPNGVAYSTFDRAESFLDNTPVFTLDANSYFVLGDDRDNSVDSRVPEIGLVRYNNLVGRVDYVLPR